MNKSKIKEKVFSILTNYLKVNETTLSEENMDVPFTAFKFNLDGRSLLYLFLKIEEEFQVHIEQEDIISNKFNTINGLISIIYERQIPSYKI